jgi:hypothetical protein
LAGHRVSLFLLPQALQHDESAAGGFDISTVGIKASAPCRSGQGPTADHEQQLCACAARKASQSKALDLLVMLIGFASVDPLTAALQLQVAPSLRWRKKARESAVVSATGSAENTHREHELRPVLDAGCRYTDQAQAFTERINGVRSTNSSR